MPITLTPTPDPGTAEGYYAKRAKILLAAGTDNFNIALNLDNDSSEADEDTVQNVIDIADRFVDGRAIVLGVTFAGDDGHAVPTTAAVFGPLSDEASRWAWTQGWRLRGDTGGGTAAGGIEGQMAGTRKDAERRIDELLGGYRQTQLTAAGADGMALIHPGCDCGVLDAQRPLCT